MSATVTDNGNTINTVRFYLTDYYSYYARPSSGVDYCLGQDSTAPYQLNSMLWTAQTNLVRARLVYNGTNMIDSAPASIVTTNSIVRRLGLVAAGNAQLSLRRQHHGQHVHHAG